MNRETAAAREGQGTQPSDPVTLTLPSRAEYVLLARLVVAQVGQVAGFGPDDVYDLKLAVTEAATNVIRHAKVSEYQVRYCATPGIVEITVTDAGGGFKEEEPTRVPDEQGGFGLTVIRNLVDEVVLEEAAGGGTRLTMIRRRDPSAEGAAS